jgi:hypothetical protein
MAVGRTLVDGVRREDQEKSEVPGHIQFRALSIIDERGDAVLTRKILAMC